MSLHPLVIEKGDGLTAIVKKTASHNVGALPVVDERGMVNGIITLRDLVALLGVGSDPLGVKVSEILTPKMVSIVEEMTVIEAVHLLSTMRIRRLPIFRAGSLKPLGILTNKDILRLLKSAKDGNVDETSSDVSNKTKNNSKFDSRISEIMTRNVISIDPEDDVRTAANRMMIFGIGGLLVTGSNGYAEGLATERDLINRLSRVRSIAFTVESMKF